MAPRVAAVVAAVALLAGCGGSDPGELRVGGASEPAEPAEPSSPGDPGEPADGLTAAGTELSLAQPAVLPVETREGATGVVELALVDVRTGVPADLEGTEGLGDAVPVFLTWEVRALDGAADLAGWSPSDDLFGIQPDGAPSGVFLTGGEVGGCAPAEAPEGWTEGEVVTGCFVALSFTGVPVAGAAYRGGGEGSEYETSPVTWVAPRGS